MKMVPLKLLQAKEIKNTKEHYKLSKMKKVDVCSRQSWRLQQSG
jgi:hypothetical protein